LINEEGNVMAAVSSASSLTASIDTLVQQYRTSLRSMSVVPLQDKKTSITARLSALSSVKTKLKALFDTVNALTNAGSSSQFQARSVTSTLASVVTGEASASATVGTHSMLVTQLAKIDTVLSSRLDSQATTIATATGEGEKTLHVTGITNDIHVMIGADDTNATVLTNIASAINAAGGNVNASVVADTPATSRLVLSAKNTGSSNAISLSDVSGTLFASIGLTSAVVGSRSASTSTNAGYVYSSTSQLDAMFTMDGIDIVRERNTVSDVLSGVTMELKGTQNPGDAPLTFTVGIDKAQIKTNIQKFISDYNAAIKEIRAKTAVNTDTHVREILAGDTVFTNLLLNLKSIATQQVDSVVLGNPESLAKIGITTAADGSLTLSDQTVFDSAMADSTQGISDLFNSTNGIAVKIKAMLNGMVSYGGQLDTARDGANSRMALLKTQITRAEDRITRQVNRYRDEFARLQSLLLTMSLQQQSLAALTSASTG
jgi:flagellar hook-associated protein 2